MSLTKIETLAPEQAALIPVYQQKWRASELFTSPIDRLKADAAVKAAYRAMGREEPETIFLISPDLDFWQEYLLLKIDNDIDVEPVYLLKMICSSTGHIHATRVPPDLISAREAIRWVNWGTDPAEFSVQT